MKDKDKGFGLIIILITIALIVVVALIFLKLNKPKDDINDQLNPVVTTNSTADPVSKDTSLDTIETELDETVILEEDFSDL